MIREVTLLVIVGCTGTLASPFKMHDDNPGWGAPHAPFLPQGWGPNLGWGQDRPAYDINPHFGFRQYSEMRYEPLTAPYTYSTSLNGPPAPQQPLAPIFKGEGAPNNPYLPGPMAAYGGGGNSLYDDGYST